eukprot:Tamp_10564.p1 GENE.Tamp_10564~~Tamp_10564.p1  ORF type:complete len:281 (+),score=21.12 Tamp_10564:198-1040(+)
MPAASVIVAPHYCSDWSGVPAKRSIHVVHALPGVLGFSIADLGEPGRVPPNTARGEDEHAPRRVCSSRAHLALAVPRAPGTAASGGPASGGTASTLEPEDGPPRDCLAGGDARRGTQGRLAAPAGPRGRSGALTQRGRASTQTSASDGRRAVDAWLQGLGLGKFVPIFAQHGLDSLTLVAELKDADAVSLVQPANVDNLAVLKRGLWTLKRERKKTAGRPFSGAAPSRILDSANDRTGRMGAIEGRPGWGVPQDVSGVYHGVGLPHFRFFFSKVPARSSG